MKKLSNFQQTIITAKLLAYADELELTKYDSFETTKAMMFVNYWRKLIKEAKKGELKESVLNEETDKLLLAYWDREPNWWGWGQRNAAKRAISVLESLNKIYSGHFEKMPNNAKANISEALAICKDCRADEYKKYKKIFAGIKLPKPIKKHDPNPHL